MNMKELSIEEKAKAYDEAIERAKRLHSEPTGGTERIVCEQIFPELKEFGDERIRQKLLFLCFSWRNNKQVNIPDEEEVEKTIAWLEKQGEHANFLSNIQVGDKVTRNEDGVLVNLSQLKRVAKKQGEQKPCMIQWKGDNLKEVIDFTGKDKNFDKWFKSFEEYEKFVHGHNDIFKLFNEDGSHYEVPVGAWIVKTPDGRNVASKSVFKQKATNKVEPKFKVGDWVVFKNKHQSIYKVEKIEDGYYILRHTHGGTFRVCVLHDEDLRLWTLKDAKSGDVICSNDGHGNDSIELIKSITDKKIEFWFCLTNSNRYEAFDRITPYTNLVSRKDATPATKEQRDQLERAMTNAGYRWNKEELKLEKI